MFFTVCQKHGTWITERANITHTIPYATSKEMSSKVVIKSLKNLSTTTTKPSQAWKVIIFFIYILHQCPSRRKIRFIYFLLLFCSLLHKNSTCQAAEYLHIYNKFSIFFKFVSRCWIIMELTDSYWFLVAIKCVAVF